MFEQWSSHPEEQDFLAAESYLSLLVGLDDAATLVAGFRESAQLRYHPAKDLLVAARRDLLPDSDLEVAADLNKIRSGRLLSPPLLVEGDPLILADGFHRICASYHYSDNAPVPCWIVSRRVLNQPVDASPWLARRAG